MRSVFFLKTVYNSKNFPPTYRTELYRIVQYSTAQYSTVHVLLAYRPSVSKLPYQYQNHGRRKFRHEMTRQPCYVCAITRMCDMDPPEGPLHQAPYTHHRMLLRIIGAWCKSTNKRILSYKDALQRTECESIETTVRTRRLLWSGALLRMGDHRLPKRVMSGELENAGKRGTVGRRKNGRTAWQRIFGYLASRGTGAPPHLTLGNGIALYVKGAVGLWPRG